MELSRDIQKRIDDFCEQLRVAEGLNKEIHEELRTHIEDKVLAYLTGEEAVTEEDALVLAEAHFGNPRVVRRMLAHVHADTLTVGLYRRLVVFGIIFICFSWLNQTVIDLWELAHAFVVRQTGEYGDAILGGTSQAFLLLTWLTMLGAMILALRHVQRQIQQRERAWWLRWSPMGLTAILLFLYIAQALVPQVMPYTERPFEPKPPTALAESLNSGGSSSQPTPTSTSSFPPPSHGFENARVYYQRLGLTFLGAVEVTIFLWWCSQTQNKWMGIGTGLSLLLAYLFLIVPSAGFISGPGALLTNMQTGELVWKGFDLTFHLRTFVNGFSYFRVILLSAGSLVLGVCGYVVLQQLQSRWHPSPRMR